MPWCHHMCRIINITCNGTRVYMLVCVWGLYSHASFFQFNEYSFINAMHSHDWSVYYGFSSIFLSPRACCDWEIKLHMHKMTMQTSCLNKQLLMHCCVVLGSSIHACCQILTNWGWVTHICVSNLTIIGSDNGLWPDWHQAIIWTNTGISSIAMS